MTGRSDWAKPVRNMVIANSTGEATSWANVPGVTHVSAQATYGGPVAPILSFSPLPGVGTSPAPAPAPAAAAVHHGAGSDQAGRPGPVADAAADARSHAGPRPR